MNSQIKTWILRHKGPIDHVAPEFQFILDLVKDQNKLKIFKECQLSSKEVTTQRELFSKILL